MVTFFKNLNQNLLLFLNYFVLKNFHSFHKYIDCKINVAQPILTVGTQAGM